MIPSRRPPRTAAAVLVAAAGLLLAGCAGRGGAVPPPASIPVDAPTVTVVATEFRFDPDAPRVAAGPVRLVVRNEGVADHDLALFAGERLVAALAGIAPGRDGTLAADLAAGEYRMVCRLPGHEAQGMVGRLVAGGG